MIWQQGNNKCLIVAWIQREQSVICLWGDICQYEGATCMGSTHHYRHASKPCTDGTSPDQMRGHDASSSVMLAPLEAAIYGTIIP